MTNVTFLGASLGPNESTFWGGDIPIFQWKLVWIVDLVQKLPELAENRDFQVLAVRNTGFWGTVETPISCGGSKGGLKYRRAVFRAWDTLDGIGRSRWPNKVPLIFCDGSPRVFSFQNFGSEVGFRFWGRSLKKGFFLPPAMKTLEIAGFYPTGKSNSVGRIR